MSNLKRVFIIEADMGLLRQWMEEFNGRVQIVWADSPTMVKNTLVGDVEIREKLPFDLIVVSPSIRNGSLAVVFELVQFIRGSQYGYQGPIVACSDVELWRDGILKAGASHHASRRRLPAEVARILGI